VNGQNVVYVHRAQNPEIRAFMEQKGLANITQLENYYFKRLQAIVRELFAQDPGKKAIFWQEVFDNNQPVSLEGILLPYSR
jgi:N-acetyl-beta-hexosaminidase